MEINLIRTTTNDAELIWKMQIKSFSELLNKYQDMYTNPGNELIEKVLLRLK